ncbi:hypodermin-A-like isoform X1 [Galleria mellonella]|uniref:Hypodermin-A-like isoform X1 n=1 Tax=Galleria mellonella TaxID=7137 RepID=A0ABM3N4S8_GALME|nr:hypodermin-A-like isoform X1 [Galleria mellonella]
MLIIHHITINFMSICLISYVYGKMEPFIVNGDHVYIEKFPHSAFLSAYCVTRYKTTIHICGSSILNQAILLTAAHCVYNCRRNSHFHAVVGNEYRDVGESGHVFSVSKSKIHDNYTDTNSQHDIALLKLKKSLLLGPRIARVSITNNPPKNVVAFVAGWGVIDETRDLNTMWLISAAQRVWNRKECMKKLGKIPIGTFCAGITDSNSYPAPGDSGSALIVNNYIQIGVVSYKLPTISNNITVYADVAYYYDWIEKNSKILYCI